LNFEKLTFDDVIGYSCGMSFAISGTPGDALEEGEISHGGASG
jgi:hypothetical protein